MTSNEEWMQPVGFRNEARGGTPLIAKRRQTKVKKFKFYPKKHLFTVFKLKA